jgi:hypothetical protein
MMWNIIQFSSLKYMQEYCEVLTLREADQGDTSGGVPTTMDVDFQIVSAG